VAVPPRASQSRRAALAGMAGAGSRYCRL